jgi:hypothetical protein
MCAALPFDAESYNNVTGYNNGKSHLIEDVKTSGSINVTQNPTTDEE